MTNTVLALLSHDGERARLMAQPDRPQRLGGVAAL